MSQAGLEFGYATPPSYGWGDGEWEADYGGAKLVCDSVICTDFPDDNAMASCKKLGAALAK